MAEVGAIFYRSHGWQAKLIRWATRGDWDHVALWDPARGTVVEAVREGVRERDELARPGERVKSWFFEVEDDELARVRAWTGSLVDQEYDLFGALFAGLRVLLNLPVAFNVRGTFYCSELVAAGLFLAGRYDLEPEGITPTELAAKLGIDKLD